MSFKRLNSDSGRSACANPRVSRVRLLKRLFLGLCVATTANGAEVEIADTPIPTGGAIQVKPNIMFVLDDSGSMEWTYLPDAASYPPYWVRSEKGFEVVRPYGFASPACNGMYYDPAVK